jgi:hypothetical protein
MTIYCIADSARSYSLCHQLIREEGLEQSELSFPTLMAISEDGVLTGVLGTHISNHQIVAGPLVLKSDRPHYWTLIRLIEHYERVMRTAGVTEYIFSVPKDAEAWLDKIDKLFHFEPYSEKDGRLWFVRKL